MKKGKVSALLPIGIFLIFYLGLGILFEYVLKIEMGFYNIPIVVAFLVALLTACLQNRKVKFDDKLTIMGRDVGDKNVITMILIFLEAGIFVGVVGRDSAESVAYFMLSIIPAKFAVAVLFLVSCFVSTAMGTSVGTITLIVPIAVTVASASGFSLPLCIASVMGGAMFGDNLSFISDTTIAACNGQGCQMKDKFRENFGIALPAAIIALVIILIRSFGENVPGHIDHAYNLIQIIPYVLVLIGGIIGINVFVTLLVGIVSGSIIMLATGNVKAFDLLTNMGSGAAGMFETVMVAVLVSAICALIRENGGFDALLNGIKKLFKGKRGGQLGVGLLVGLMDIATANNTVAIVMANPIAKEISQDYGISKRKTASLLDTFSCIFQGVIPYGA
ncbi:MAG: Na+/H+ antiporter NhaC family protein, partial [Clostridia bacterium]|nr:Na+/H+ antiporter NhaC family protein [Clostridia bacterium]